ncbi:MAG TPA: DUF3426 domain-containing protein [Syntrophales bacterium]|nr:DUF3426 domain-containing protein [Syntrophales bacterium]
MNIPNETFDLVREKQELEAFLSTFSAAGPSLLMEDIKPPDPVDPVTPVTPYPAIFGKFDITVPVKNKGVPLQKPETDASEPLSLLQEEALYEPVPDAAEAAVEGRQEEPPVPKLEMETTMAPVMPEAEALQEPVPDPAEAAVESEREEPPELAVKQAPPAFVEFQPAGRLPEEPEERRDIPEMDRTLRIDRKTIEEAAAENGLSLQTAADIGEEKTKPESGSAPSAGRGTSRPRPVLIGLLLCLALALSALGYFLVRPADGQALVRWLSVNVPFAGQYLEVGSPVRNPVAEQVGVVNLRHRFVRNAALGREIRVVEGTAFNRGHAGISGIRIRGELYDARGMLVTARMVSCGSGLTADQLETLGEADLHLAISAAQSGPQANGEVPPGGETPFMIVFIQEPPGVVRAMVEPVRIDKARLP